jgi:hypothetical protein
MHVGSYGPDPRKRRMYGLECGGSGSAPRETLFEDQLARTTIASQWSQARPKSLCRSLPLHLARASSERSALVQSAATLLLNSVVRNAGFARLRGAGRSMPQVSARARSLKRPIRPNVGAMDAVALLVGTPRAWRAMGPAFEALPQRSPRSRARVR